MHEDVFNAKGKPLDWTFGFGEVVIKCPLGLVGGLLCRYSLARFLATLGESKRRSKFTSEHMLSHLFLCRVTQLGACDIVTRSPPEPGWRVSVRLVHFCRREAFSEHSCWAASVLVPTCHLFLVGSRLQAAMAPKRSTGAKTIAKSRSTAKAKAASGSKRAAGDGPIDAAAKPKATKAKVQKTDSTETPVDAEAIWPESIKAQLDQNVLADVLRAQLEKLPEGSLQKMNDALCSLADESGVLRIGSICAGSDIAFFCTAVFAHVVTQGKVSVANTFCCEADSRKQQFLQTYVAEHPWQASRPGHGCHCIFADLEDCFIRFP